MPTVAPEREHIAKSDASNDTGVSTRNEAALLHRELILRGYIRRSKDGKAYDGICITLNLPVRGRSSEEAQRKLHDLIAAYLQDAHRSGNWDELVPRRAPVSYYLEYCKLVLLSLIPRIQDFKIFKESAPTCQAHA